MTAIVHTYIVVHTTIYIHSNLFPSLSFQVEWDYVPTNYNFINGPTEGEELNVYVREDIFIGKTYIKVGVCVRPRYERMYIYIYVCTSNLPRSIESCNDGNALTKRDRPERRKAPTKAFRQGKAYQREQCMHVAASPTCSTLLDLEASCMLARSDLPMES